VPQRLFAAQYGAERVRDRVRLKLKISRGSPSMISIETNIPGGDLWFTLDSGSPAETTKFRLVDWLNTCATGSSQTFEVTEDVDGCVVLRFLLQPVPPAEMVWQEVEQRLAGASLLSRCEESHGVHRVYVKQDLIYKVQLLRRPNPKPLSLAEEYNVLCRLDGVCRHPLRSQVRAAF